MQTRFLLGPAGSGKTFHCLAEIRKTLAAAPDGPPLILLAPKQTTYQLERQLLADPSLQGYTRLHILSFDRLAFFLAGQLKQNLPPMLDEEGRLMVLRGLLAQKRDELKLFRASARLTGFAQHLSSVLRELQRHQLTPESLRDLALQFESAEKLSSKLYDLATLLGDYLEWLTAHQLQDADCLLDFAAGLLREPHAPLELGELWMDGFTELSPQELSLLAELLPKVPRATITFCLDRIPAEKVSWLSTWSVVRHLYQQCEKKIAALPSVQIVKEALKRRLPESRFVDNPILLHLESHWSDPKPFTKSTDDGPITRSLRIASCANPTAEATLAAREILRFVRAGGRYREVTVLARNLESYHEPISSVFARYGIPFFLDRRESVAHHPLAELTRNALRTIALSWTHSDWFAALKTGLARADETEIDQLENEALARGWKGKAWQKIIEIETDPQRAEELDRIRRKIIPPFNRLAIKLGNKPTGIELSEAVREFWQALDVAAALQKWSTQEDDPRPIHLTVWEQMGQWLENVELGFGNESLPLREWLPVLEAGLSGLSVGVLPPTVDQVSVGAIDRSRNPDIRLALVLGMNEGIFPAPPQPSLLLTDSDRMELEQHGLSLSVHRQQIGRERFFGYTACTRARERLVLTHSTTDATGRALNPSPFLAHVQEIFPGVEQTQFPRTIGWPQSEHPVELIAPLLRNQADATGVHDPALRMLEDLPALQPLRNQLRELVSPAPTESLSPALAQKLYGANLRTSVSKMEQFAACPFKFFVHSGLRAEERKLFELDIRDHGNFQHDALAKFHESLTAENKRWRDITPAQARERIKAISAEMVMKFREGIMHASVQGQFTARMLAESLQDFIETLVAWMHSQYAFDPKAVEMPFGEKNDDGSAPPWDLDLGDGHHLLLSGRIDRIDLSLEKDGETAFCVVIDYKSSQKKLDPLLMENGLQLQLPAYLNVLRHWPDPKSKFGVSKLLPVGVFYVNLRGRYERGTNRDETLAKIASARGLAYRHSGRFDTVALDQLDRLKDQREEKSGDQFNYKLKKDGNISGVSKEALSTEQFTALLEMVEASLKSMGRAIYAGITDVAPYRRGTMTACDQCDYQPICRIDAWTHSYRGLKKTVPTEPLP